MDSANTGMRSRSTGSSGAGRRHWRRTYQAPTSRPAPSSHQPEGREESAPPARTPSCSPPRKIRLNMRMLSSTSSGDSRAPAWPATALAGSARRPSHSVNRPSGRLAANSQGQLATDRIAARSEEHTSELQSQSNLVCRLLLEKKKTYSKNEEDAVAYPALSPTASCERLRAADMAPCPAPAKSRESRAATAPAHIRRLLVGPLDLL